jgi:hypothetical protein
MISKRVSFRARFARQAFVSAAIGMLGVGALAGEAPAAAGGPFAGLAGAWSVNGTVTYASGTKERLRCKVKYDQTNEDSISQALRCASDSYKFEINAYYKHSGGALSGHWDEFTLQISGSISGTASAGRIAGDLRGPGFTAAVLVDTHGNEQTVTISAADQEIRQVSVAVRKSGN